MTLSNLLLFVLVIAVAFAIARFLSRPHTVIRIEDGHAQVLRGQLPSGLQGDLHDVVARMPGALGRIELAGGGSKLSLRTEGLDDTLSQRIRNVIFLYRDRIR